MKQRLFFILFILVAIMVFPKVECSAADSSYWSDDGIRATSFSNTSGTTITIMNAAELGLLAYDVNNSVSTYSGYTIELNGNINLSAHKWKPIGPNVTAFFAGTFDGKHNKITGLYINETRGAIGLFGNIYETTVVKNLSVDCTIISTSGSIGGIAGSSKGYIYNCSVNALINPDAYNCRIVGGIVGNNGGYVYNCFVNGNLKYSNSTGTGQAGLIIGAIMTNNGALIGWIEDCYYQGNVAYLDSSGNAVVSETPYYNASTPCSNVYKVSGNTLNNTAEFTIGSITIPISGDLVTALNAWVTTNGSSTYSTWCYQNGTAAFEDLYNVSISWGDVTGVYTQTWNTDTRTNTYEWNSPITAITFGNSSNIAVNAQFTYTPNEFGTGTEITFYDPAQGLNINSFIIPKGAINTQIRATLGGTPTNFACWNNTEIGTITISISKSEG